ncbi:hypothetical protein HY546_00220 [archaeon]|nr:hypothetical protein [archaeon]
MLSTTETVAMLATLAVSAALCFLVVREVIRKLKDKKYFETELGLVVPDFHKADKPAVPKLGGVGIAFGLAAGIAVSAVYASFNSQAETAKLLAMFSSVITLGLIGLADDIFKTRYRTRVIAPLLAVVPLLVVIPSTVVLIPFAGGFDLGWLYYLLAVAGFVVLANAVNMVGGFNGSESGLGSVTLAALLALTIATSQLAPALFLAAALGSLMAFLKFNWFPAKCLPGNMTTHIIGGVIASAALVGKMEFLAAVLSLIYVVEFFLKAKGGFSVKWWGALQPDGTLAASDDHTYSVHMFFMKRFKLTEKGLVTRVIAVQAAVAIVALAMVFAGTR